MISVDLSLMGLLKGNVFNFISVLCLIVLLLLKLDVAAKLESAKNKIIELINKSEEDKLLSEKTLEDSKNEVINLPQELEEIHVDAQDTVNAYKKSVDTDLQKTVLKLQNNAQKVIDNEVLRINAALQNELAIEAIELAHKKTLENLKNDAAQHRKFIAEAIDKLEDVEI